MHTLQNQAEIIVLAYWPCYTKSPQCLIEKASHNYYLSEKGLITDNSAELFTKKIVRNGHFSVIEHV